MSRMHFRVLALAAGASIGLGGCQWLGPTSIEQGRDRYNSVIQQTSMEQTLSNIVRTYNHQPSLFMDVTEVDASASFGGSMSGGIATTTPAANSKTGELFHGLVGSFGGSTQISETPTIRYQPLLGQALVAQLVSPVSVDALGRLYDSYWDAPPLLDFSIAYLSLDYSEFYPALNSIAELNDKGAIQLVAGKSKFADAKEAGADKNPVRSEARGTITVNVADKTPREAGGNDSLIVYLLPFHAHQAGDDLSGRERILQLWIRLLRIYRGTQPEFVPSAGCRSIKFPSNEQELRDWDMNIDAYGKKYDLEAVRKCLPDTIELRTVPVARDKAGENLISAAPLMRTYSALGLLKNATERPHPRIEFVSPKVYRDIRAQPWNKAVESSSFYTLLPEHEDSFNCPAERGKCDNPGTGDQAADDKIANDVTDWIKHADSLFSYERKSGAAGDALDDEHIGRNRRLGLLRRYILVVVDENLPAGPVYAAYEEGGKWYYIAADDTISQKNFHLLSLFLTMMAIPSQLPPLSPVINVGG